MHTAAEILEILADIKPGTDIAPDTELIRSGILDSLEIMNLAMALAEELDIEISPLELKEENFTDVNAIVALVNRLEDEE